MTLQNKYPGRLEFNTFPKLNRYCYFVKVTFYPFVCLFTYKSEDSDKSMCCATDTEAVAAVAVCSAPVHPLSLVEGDHFQRQSPAAFLAQ